MNKSSLQKAAVGAAISVGLITAVAWYSGTPETERRTITGVAPGERPPDIERGVDVQPGFRPSGLEVSEGTTIQRTDPETGELEQEFFYEQLKPREEGVFDLVAPQARLYLSPTRVITLRSRAGRFVAPDNHPQSGQFRDEVVITVYQSDGEETLDLSRNSPHRVLQIELDEAEFDTVLGEIRSTSDVVVTTPATGQVEFAGQGLTLLYNELERRIEYMRIMEGRSLRYTATTSTTADDADTDTDADVAADEADAAPPADAQFYRLTFEREIVATSAANQIEADQLVAFFSMESGAEATAQRPRSSRPSHTLAARDRQPAPRSGGIGGVARSVAMTTTLAALPSTQQQTPGVPRPASAERDGRTSETPTDATATDAPPDELVMTWSGSMVMVPVDAPPPQVQSVDDVYVQFEGGPVRVGLEGGEQLTCHTLRYSERSGQVDAIGTNAYPMRLTSPELGTATAGRLLINLNENHARLAGAGSIRTERRDDAQAGASSSRGLPPGFRAQWSEHVDIHFAQRTDGPGSIEAAQFVGNVEIRDDQFDLKSQSLTTRFARGSNGEGGSPQLEQVEADGNVTVTLANSSIAAGWLRIETAADEEGRYHPTRLLAEGNVQVIDERQQLEAQQLTVALGPASETSESTPEESAEDDVFASRVGRIQVRQLEAEQDVQLRVGDGMRVSADYLAGDALTGDAHLRGQPVVLARYAEGVEVDDDTEPLSELRVAELFLEDEGRLGHADGPGEFAYLEPAEDADDLDQRVRVTWNRRMQYDDATQTIEVHGNVIAEAEDGPTEVNRLTSSQLTLELIDPAVAAAAKGEEPAAPAAEDDDQPVNAMASERQLHRLIATGDATLLGTRWTDAQQERVLTRFRVAGPELTFDNIDRIAAVEGAGSLLIEDYRPVDEQPDAEADETEPEADASPAPLAATPMTGRGATLFTWANELVINEADGDMVMDGQVNMTHRPHRRNDVVELRADRLVADMDSMRGLQAMGMTDVQSMQINHITASGTVQVRDAQRMINAGNMYYDGPSRSVLLRAGNLRHVQVIRTDEPRPLRASEILWNLEDDSIEILDAGL